MASPSLSNRRSFAASRALVATAVLALFGAALVAWRSARAGDRPCWGDIVADAYVPSVGQLAQLPPGPSVGRRLSRTSVALGDFELHFVPAYHRFDDTAEIGWDNMSIVDPSSCSETAIPLDRSTSGWPIDPTIAVFRDEAHDVYIVHSSRQALAVFRRRSAPGTKHVWPQDLGWALLLDSASAAALLVGLVRAARARPGDALLAISLLLSAFGALFGLGM